MIFALMPGTMLASLPPTAAEVDGATVDAASVEGVVTAAVAVGGVVVGATVTASVVDVAVVDVAGVVVADAMVTAVGCGAAPVVLAETDPDPPLAHAVVSAVRPSRPNTARRVMASSNQPTWFALPRLSSTVASPSS